MATRTCYCPKCNTLCDSSDSFESACNRCEGTGRVQADADAGLIPYAKSRRPAWMWGLGLRPHRDPLAELARFRAINPRSVAYREARRAAMKLVDLPLDDAHLLPSPETCAYFNALTRAAA